MEGAGVCVGELLQDITEKTQKPKTRAWSLDPGKKAELGSGWWWISPGGHEGGRRKASLELGLGEEATASGPSPEIRLGRELMGS